MLLRRGRIRLPKHEYSVIGFAFAQRRQDIVLQNGKNFRVAEKLGDINQQFPEQLMHLGGIFLQKTGINISIFDAVL